MGEQGRSHGLFRGCEAEVRFPGIYVVSSHENHGADGRHRSAAWLMMAVMVVVVVAVLVAVAGCLLWYGSGVV